MTYSMDAIKNLGKDQVTLRQDGMTRRKQRKKKIKLFIRKIRLSSDLPTTILHAKRQGTSMVTLLKG